MTLGRLSAVLLLGALCASAQETIDAFGLRWFVPVPSDWRVEDGVLRLLVPRPSTQPRRPAQYALADTPDLITTTIEAELQPEPKQVRNRRNSLILVYAWRDKDHFNYAHLSVDTGRQAAHHNGIFHVYGGDRVRISALDGPAALTDGKWHQVKLAYDGRSGRVDVWVDGETSPALRAVDMSLGAGKAGIGSFFDMGMFRKVKISGQPASGRPAKGESGTP